MQVSLASAALGWKWVTDGFGLLRRHPLALLGLTVLFLFTIIIPTVIPVIGGFAPLLLTPALSVGYMQAVRTAESGRMPTPWMLYDGFRAQGGRDARPLLLLGLINCVLTVAVLAITMLADGGTLFRIATGTINGDDPALAESGLLFAAIVFLLLYTPVQMAMWYAPMFVAWHRLQPVKALFYSLVGVWRNKRAFLVYMVGWFGVAVAISVAVQIVKLVLPANLMPLLLSPLSLVMLAALYCSFWPAYRDVVRDGPDYGPAQAAGEPPPTA
jgi:hypothetical protein